MAQQTRKTTAPVDGRHRVFVAYPYSFDLHGYRAVFKSVERKLKNILFIFADEAISSETVLDKITKMISDSEFGIYDITSWNANVTLEYGVARGMKRKAVIAFNPALNGNTQVPSDVAGYDRIQYENYADLEAGLIREVTTLLPVGNQTVRERSNDVESSILIDLLRAGEAKSKSQIATDLGVNAEVVFVFLQRLKQRGEVEVVGIKKGAKWKATSMIQKSSSKSRHSATGSKLPASRATKVRMRTPAKSGKARAR